MEIRIESRNLADVVVLTPDIFQDVRGFFMETFRQDQFSALGLPHDFVQDNHSRSVKGVVRGLHFQWDPPPGKLMRVVTGRAFMVALDIRDYLRLSQLRQDLCRLVTDFCAANPQQAGQQAFEPFFFCESIEVTVPLGVEAWTLAEFRSGLEQMSHASLHFHFLASRLRLQLRTNDFSYWFDTGLGLPPLADRTNRIDVYTNTLESARNRLLALVDEELAS